MNRFTVPALCLCVVVSTCLRAQNPAELIAQAGQAAGSGQFAEAARLYERAAMLRDNRPEWLYQAAEHYYRVRDYRKASDCYRRSLGELSKSELSGLRYARALKQEGRYTEAVEAFRSYAATYTGDRKATVLAVVANELNGCDLALRLLADTVQRHIPPEALAVMPRTVNTRDRESAPLLWRDDVLYFTRLTAASTGFWRSIRRFGSWQEAAEGRGFPATVAPRLGSATFTPDGNGLYCTLCEEMPVHERHTPGLRARCELFLLRKTPQGWQEPERLRDYINLPDQTVLHPFVLHQAGREVLFFSSNREGTLGGLDIYVCQRSLESDSLDFSLPQNLGPQVNSAGDDITPCFDPLEQVLWFSSNGHPGIGGLDVYRTQFSGGKWLAAAHAGLPVNSPYDDYFFLKKKNGDGILVSNRPSGAEKPDTQDDDLFEFFPEKMPATTEEYGPVTATDSTLVAAVAAPAAASPSATGFRVCLEVVQDFEPGLARYQSLHTLGTVQAISMPEQGSHRVLLGPFASRAQAQETANALRQRGNFPQAFVVRH